RGGDSSPSGHQGTTSAYCSSCCQSHRSGCPGPDTTAPSGGPPVENRHTPSNLVGTHWNSAVESTTNPEFLLGPALWTPFGCLMISKIRSIISVACGFTTKSDGI